MKLDPPQLLYTMNDLVGLIRNWCGEIYLSRN